MIATTPHSVPSPPAPSFFLARARVLAQLSEPIATTMPAPRSGSSASDDDARARSRLEALVADTNIRQHVGELPPVALPTVALATFCVVAHACTIHAASTAALSHQAASALCALFTYLAFTPMHDACHGSVASHPSLRFLNNVVGSACGALFPLPFAAFKRMHLLHHKHTNDESLDPDVWAAKGPRLLLPLRWITVELSYYSMYAPPSWASPSSFTRAPSGTSLKSSPAAAP